MFSVTAWKKLFPDEKQLHTLQKCKACEAQIQVTECYFSMQTWQQEKPLIFFNKKDLLSSTRFSQKALQELNTLTKENLSKPDIPRSISVFALLYNRKILCQTFLAV